MLEPDVRKRWSAALKYRAPVMASPPGGTFRHHTGQAVREDVPAAHGVGRPGRTPRQTLWQHTGATPAGKRLVTGFLVVEKFHSPPFSLAPPVDQMSPPASMTSSVAASGLLADAGVPISWARHPHVRGVHSHVRGVHSHVRGVHSPFGCTRCRTHECHSPCARPCQSRALSNLPRSTIGLHSVTVGAEREFFIFYVTHEFLPHFRTGCYSTFTQENVCTDAPLPTHLTDLTNHTGFARRAV
jgi:hypothetical protein